jgi:hypothetical protein
MSVVISMALFIVGTTPTYLEAHLDEWMEQNRGLATFLHDPVFELLPRPNPSITASNSPAGLELGWSDLGVHYVYTPETANSLNSTNWSPAPGTNWPTTATNWTTTAAMNQSRFYRIKAELKNP